MEEIKFEKLSDVAEVAELADGDYLVAVKDGEVVKISKNEVGGNYKRELMYEWNFSAEDNVHEIIENVDDDLSWLLKPNAKVGYEVEAEVYYCSQDEDENMIVHEDKALSMFMNDAVYNGYFNGIVGHGHLLDICGSRFEMYGNEVRDESDWMNALCLLFRFYDRYHYDIYNDSFSEVEKGGNICIIEDWDNPIKSVRIYKVTK